MVFSGSSHILLPAYDTLPILALSATAKWAPLILQPYTRICIRGLRFIMMNNRYIRLRHLTRKSTTVPSWHRKHALDGNEMQSSWNAHKVQYESCPGHISLSSTKPIMCVTVAAGKRTFVEPRLGWIHRQHACVVGTNIWCDQRRFCPFREQGSKLSLCDIPMYKWFWRLEMFCFLLHVCNAMASG